MLKKKRVSLSLRAKTRIIFCVTILIFLASWAISLFFIPQLNLPLVLLFMVCGLSVSALVYVILTDSTISKFNELVYRIRTMENGFSLTDKLKEDDFIVLKSGFEYLHKRVGNLKSEIHEAEIKRKDMQIQLLQTKIKPHFLYNNLSAINWLALENDQNQIGEIATALSDFYRSALNQGKEMSSLETELTNAKAYMTLQTLAHSGDLYFSMEVQEQIGNIEVPGFIIQPLLENAIEHGTDQLIDGKGIIKLSVSTDDRLLYITVIDNGQELYKKIGDNLLEKDQFGYGLSNVNDRIQLLYGNTYGVFVRAKNEKTEASIVLPPNYRWLVGGGLLNKEKQLIKEKIMDSALKPANVMRNPGDPKYKKENRRWQGIPSLERTRNGRLYVNFYTGMKGEEAGNFVVLVHSDDNGKTWTDAEIVIEHDDLEIRCFDPALWLDPLGRLWFTWTQSRQFYDGRHGVWAIVSSDPDAEVPQWTEPRRIANGLMMNKPIVNSKDEWLFPCALWSHESSKPSEEHPELAFEIGSNVYVSTDKGNSFNYRGGADTEGRAFDEHMLVEKKNGQFWMLIRTKYGIGQSFSNDQGKTWTPGEDSGIPGPNSRFFIRRLASGRLLMVNHGSSEQFDGEKIYRTRSMLCAKLSEDDGKTWIGGLLLDERLKVSYPDGAQDENGVIYIVYDWDRYDAREILMATFTEEDILAGKCVSPHARLQMLVSKATGEKTR